MAKQITVYTRNGCASCVNVKKYLDLKQHQYDVINLDEDPTAAHEVITKSGSRTVPVVLIKDEETMQEHFAVGWNPGRLAAILTA